MPTAPQAFDVGLGLNLVGVPFDAQTVLHVARQSGGEVGARAQAQAQALGAHAKQAGRHLKTIRGVLAEMGQQERSHVVGFFFELPRLITRGQPSRSRSSVVHSLQ